MENTKTKSGSGGKPNKKHEVVKKQEVSTYGYYIGPVVKSLKLRPGRGYKDYKKTFKEALKKYPQLNQFFIGVDEIHKAKHNKGLQQQAKAFFLELEKK